MTIEGSQPGHTSDHILGWLEDSVSFLPSGFDDACLFDEFHSYQWWEWDQTQETAQDLVHSFTADFINNNSGSNSNNGFTNERTADLTPGSPVINPNPPPLRDQSRKRNAAGEEVRTVKRSAGSRRNSNKPTGNNCNNGNKEGRWAEQLLNPCAAAIMAGNMSRVQHYLYVLRELASSKGDPNHRLAAYGLKALTQHLSCSPSAGPAITFASAEPRIFQQSLLKFHEVSPWFSFPNNMANSAILQILAQQPCEDRNLHILDFGVSHGTQWPTLLEALSRRPGGPPSRVRITVVSATSGKDQSTETPPFSVGLSGHNYSSQLLSFARSLNINLQISKLDDPLQNLNTQIVNASTHETLIVCAQFRMHQQNHNSPDERTHFLKELRGLEPKGLILCENNTECSCSSCGDFATGFSKKLNDLWNFLDSTSVAFKGQESEERRVMEGEAVKALMSEGEMNEGKDKWYARMRGAGFAAEGFEEDAIYGARAFLRKYDSNWEMRVEEGDSSVGLWWKGEPVSFCSLWKMDVALHRN